MLAAVESDSGSRMLWLAASPALKGVYDVLHEQTDMWSASGNGCNEGGLFALLEGLSYHLDSYAVVFLIL